MRSSIFFLLRYFWKQYFKFNCRIIEAKIILLWRLKYNNARTHWLWTHNGRSPVRTHYITLWDYAARNKHSLMRFQDSGEKQESEQLPAKLRSAWRFLLLYHSQKNSPKTEWQLESLCVFQVSSWGTGECTMLSEIQISLLSPVNILLCYFLTYNFCLKKTNTFILMLSDSYQ